MFSIIPGEKSVFILAEEHNGGDNFFFFDISIKLLCMNRQDANHNYHYM